MNGVPETLETIYLEMTDRAQFRPGFAEDAGLLILRTGSLDLAYYKFIYQQVGESWRWRDRLIMPESELETILSHPGCTVDVLYVEGVPAGYIELLREGSDTEIAYFGLRERFFGRGLGKHLLSWGIQSAWDDGAERVWLHTCNLDGPHALANYLARGFHVYKTTEMPMPERYL
jgi:GNAT superfamily N-acetyltransferase